MTSARTGRRSGLRDTSAPLVGSAINGVLAYVVFALTTRVLGSEAASPVSVLWSYWSFAGAALTFPLQHWVSRTVTAHGEGEVHRNLPRVSGVVVVVSVVAALLAWVVRGDLFHRESLWWPVLTGLITLGSALIGVARGGLTARSRFYGLTGSLALENLVRCLGVGALAVAGVHEAVWYGVCLVLGHLSALVWPSALRYGRERHEPGGGDAGSALRFLTGAAGGQLLGQVVLTGGPVVLALSGGAAGEVTALFAALALFRAPYVLALGAVAPLTARMTTLVVTGRVDLLARFRAMVVGLTVVGAVLAGLFGAWAGPFLLRLVFGGDVRLAAGHTSLVAAASLVAVANLVLVIGVIASNRPRVLVLAWLAAGVVAAVLLALLPGAAVDRVVWAFLAAEVVAFAALALTRPQLRPRAVHPARQPGV